MAQGNTIYRAKKAASLVNPTSASTFVQSDDSTKAAAVYFPVLPQAAAPATLSFRFRALGRALNSGSHNVTPKVSYGVSTTAGSNTVIAAATARAVSTAQANWCIWGMLFWEAANQKLSGVFSALNGITAVLDTEAVLTSTVASVDLSASGLGLSVEITIATGGGDTGYLDELALEVL